MTYRYGDIIIDGSGKMFKVLGWEPTHIYSVHVQELEDGCIVGYMYWINPTTYRRITKLDKVLE